MRGPGGLSVRHSTVGEVVMKLRDCVIAIGNVSVGAAAPFLALSRVVELEAQLVTRRIAWGAIFSSTDPGLLEVGNGLDSNRNSGLKSSAQSPIGVGMFHLVLGQSWEHATSTSASTSSSSTSANARELMDHWPKFGYLGLDYFHPLVGDSW